MPLSDEFGVWFVNFGSPASWRRGRQLTASGTTPAAAAYVDWTLTCGPCNKMEAVVTGQMTNTPQHDYPSSPARACHAALSPLAALGIAPGASAATGFAVQYGEPRGAGSVKLLAFPKPGADFDKWWDHALDPIIAAPSFCTEAHRWALQCGKSGTTL